MLTLKYRVQTQIRSETWGEKLKNGILVMKNMI